MANWIPRGFGVVKVGPGVVGRSTTVAASAMAVLLMLAWKSQSEETFYAVLIGVLVIFAVYFIGVLIFANKNPAAALMEGTQLLDMRKTEMSLQGKVMPPEASIIAPPIIDVDPEKPND